MKRCEQCGVEYVPQVPWQRFCSDKCRDAWHAPYRRVAKRLREMGRQDAASRAKAEAHEVFGT